MDRESRRWWLRRRKAMACRPLDRSPYFEPIASLRGRRLRSGGVAPTPARWIQRFDLRFGILGQSDGQRSRERCRATGRLRQAPHLAARDVRAGLDGMPAIHSFNEITGIEGYRLAMLDAVGHGPLVSAREI